MSLRPPQHITLTHIVGGGQAIGTLESGKKAFVWGGLPGEEVVFRITKKKSHFVEGVVEEVITPSPERIEPLDKSSFLSTSPWQIMNFEAEQHYKAALIEEAFELHNIVLPDPIDIYTDKHTIGYRNKMEFSWYGDTSPSGDTLDLAFFVRGSKGKMIVNDSSLAHPNIIKLAIAIRDLLRKKSISARALKTLLIRTNQQGVAVWQLYVKDPEFVAFSDEEVTILPAQGGEIIYSDPRSPASRITKRLASYGDTVLRDTILGIPFRYATEGFFQVNIPVYEQALKDMRKFITDSPVIDMYSGVGTIGLTIGGDSVTLVEVNEDAIREMRRNITELGKEHSAIAVLAPSEKTLEHITVKNCVVIDPPRAGLHADVIARLLDQQPQRIIYLSCNPVTQARDIALLSEVYGIRYHRGYNFFPRTPHSEHLVVLDKKST